MLELLIVAVIVAAIGLVAASAAAVAWRRERRRCRRLTEQLQVDGHIERLTLQTLQAMRQVARDQLRAER